MIRPRDKVPAYDPDADAERKRRAADARHAAWRAQHGIEHQPTPARSTPPPRRAGADFSRTVEVREAHAARVAESGGVERRDARALVKKERESVLAGHSAMFDSPTLIADYFIETIAPGAFDDALKEKQDTVALFNHDRSALLGRVAAGTLRLSTDSKGLRYEIDAPDTAVGRDVVALVERGDLRGSSFSFVVDDERWTEDEGGKVKRTILRVSQLRDVSVVTHPAYTDTSVSAA